MEIINDDGNGPRKVSRPLVMIISQSHKFLEQIKMLTKNVAGQTIF